MNKIIYVPDRGDIIWLDLNPRIGHEQSGHRPGLVLSPRRFNEKTGLAIICPITSQVKGLPLEIRIKDGKIDGVILPMHIKSVDIATRHAQYIQKASSTVLNQTAKYVRLITE
ncbi:MAG TPA: type II toxin-antitoxin system PemK/MazF family toxin [Patescibacteria group bacterium]|nr:type II toxin-antitoxin system PemK/MazF family toxin [Patescibacteria group bacterium]